MIIGMEDDNDEVMNRTIGNDFYQNDGILQVLVQEDTGDEFIQNLSHVQVDDDREEEQEVAVEIESDENNKHDSEENSKNDDEVISYKRSILRKRSNAAVNSNDSNAFTDDLNKISFRRKAFNSSNDFLSKFK